MAYVIKCIALAGRTRNPASVPVGDYLASYNPDAMDGYGMATWTPDIGRAMTFRTHAAAWDEWLRQSRVRPLRDDGAPNRPLTAYTILPVPVEQHARPIP